MNGYETMSENYKILMQRGEIEKEAAEKAIRVYDFLAGCDTDDLCEMIDSSAFNDLIRAFLVRAVTSAGLDDDDRSDHAAAALYLRRTDCKRGLRSLLSIAKAGS